MRTLVHVLLACMAGLSMSHAQNRELLYDFSDIPQSLMLNPGGTAHYEWYAGIPFLSGMGFNVGSSGITAQDLFANDGVDINEKFREKALFGMKPSDDLSGTYQIELISGGFRGRNRPDNFYTFGLYNEVDGIGYWFGDLALLAWEGNAGQLGRRFDLSHLSTRGEMVNVFHFGLNKQINSKMILGARAKIYSGIFNFRTTRNEGYFVTTEGADNLLANTLVADMRLQTSGLEGIREAISDNEEGEAAALGRHMLKRGFFGGDLGLGVDLGGTYYLDEQLVVTGSLLDLGFMVHKSDIRNYDLKGSATSEGVQVILPGAIEDPDPDFWQDLVDEIEALVPFEENQDAYVTLRPTKFYGSVRYNFGKMSRAAYYCNCDYRVSGRYISQIFQNGVGLQLFAVNRPRAPQAALTAFYYRRIGNFMALKATYTVDRYSMSNLGLGGHLQIGLAQFYLMADNLLSYRNIGNTSYVSLQFGVNILSWARK